MNVQRVYNAAFGLFGLAALARAVPRLADSPGLADWLAAVGGAVVLVAAGVGLARPEASGAPEEPGLLLYLALVGVAGYVLATLLTVL